ncbi:MAG: hypothetical protein HKL90_07905 [Elusimicrobia bacterium]|nr:hypothetical protein [Elusimicrobiota bacterium]
MKGLAVLIFLAVGARSVRAAVDCLSDAGSGAPPATFAQLRACQDRRRADALKKARLAGRNLTESQLEALDDLQRAQARRFFATSGVVDSDGPPTAASVGANPGALGGATPADLSRVGAGGAAAVTALQARLHAAAGDGGKGITPAMAADIRSTLIQAQGGVSPDMQALLDAVAKDGGKLTPGTMQLLQGAGRSAKAEGLDLNIDPSIEKDLLSHDFNDDKKYFPSGGASSSPGSM